jgi:predicted HAD superfamily phosphohydrolase YqeG
MGRIEKHKHIGDIPFLEWQKKFGIKAVGFDLDNTLTDHLGDEIDQRVEDGLVGQNFKDIFDYPTIIISNHVDHKHVLEFGNHFKERIGVNEVLCFSRGEGWAPKPNPIMVTMALRQCGIRPEHFGYGGDRWWSDLLLGVEARLGKIAIVDPIGNGDAPFVKPFRVIEKGLIRASIYRDRRLQRK